MTRLAYLTEESFEGLDHMTEWKREPLENPRVGRKAQWRPVHFGGPASKMGRMSGQGINIPMGRKRPEDSKELKVSSSERGLGRWNFTVREAKE